MYIFMLLMAILRFPRIEDSELKSILWSLAIMLIYIIIQICYEYTNKTNASQVMHTLQLDEIRVR